MSDKPKIINKIEDAYSDFSENPAIMWFRGVLQTLDVEFTPNVGVKISVGQFLERFIFTQAEIIARQRTEQAIKDLNKRLKEMEIDHAVLVDKSEEYAKLFLRFYGAVGSQSFEELRYAYVNQFSSFFDKKYSNIKNKQFYQQLLFKLTIEHFAILSFSEKYLGKDKGVQFENSKTLTEVLLKEFKEKKEMSEALIRGLIRDLDSMGLFNDWQSSALGGDIHGLSVTDLGRELLLQVNSREIT